MDGFSASTHGSKRLGQRWRSGCRRLAGGCRGRRWPAGMGHSAASAGRCAVTGDRQRPHTTATARSHLWCGVCISLLWPLHLAAVGGRWHSGSAHQAGGWMTE